jgi:hypothetical protein
MSYIELALSKRGPQNIGLERSVSNHSIPGDGFTFATISILGTRVYTAFVLYKFEYQSGKYKIQSTKWEFK